jgi:hypothetical protein
MEGEWGMVGGWLEREIEHSDDDLDVKVRWT